MTIHELKAELAARMETLALALLPEPPTTKTRHELRFGAKGALAVRIAGAKRGTFCDYAAGARGDALAFIAHARQCPPREAFQWARQWLGGAFAPHRRRRTRPCPPQARRKRLGACKPRAISGVMRCQRRAVWPMSGVSTHGTKLAI